MIHNNIIEERGQRKNEKKRKTLRGEGIKGCVCCQKKEKKDLF